MTPLDRWLGEVEARRKRCAEVLDVGGTEQALIGGDIDTLLALLRRAVEGYEELLAYGMPTHIEAGLCAILDDLARLAREGEKG